MDIVTIGNLSIDSIKTVKTKIESIPGGAAGASACAASLNNCKVGIVSKVGVDFLPYLEELKKYNIDLDGVRTCNGKTTKFHLTYNKNFDLINIEEIWGSSTDLNISEIPKKYKNAKCFHICPNSPVLHSLFLDLKKKNVLMSLDPHMLYEHELAKKMLSKFDIVTPNETEAYRMTKEKRPWKAARLLAAYGPKIVVIKRGNKGAFVYEKEKNEYYDVLAFKANVIDTTGCGDAWIGAFLSEYIRSKDILKSAQLSSVISSFVAEKIGAYVPIVSFDEINARFEKLKSLGSTKTARAVKYSKKEKKFLVD